MITGFVGHQFERLLLRTVCQPSNVRGRAPARLTPVDHDAYRAMNERTLLVEQHLAFLHDRGVSPDVAAARGYRSAVKKSELADLGFGRTQQLVPSLVIPVFSVRGSIESYQLRPDHPRLNRAGKARKYEMKGGAGMLIDVHSWLTRLRENNKTSLISDPSVPLWISEGIAKGDSAVSVGLCCVTLLGVWNFRGTNSAGGTTALADWECVALNGRKVYIAFDSDVMEKRQVHAALARLKAFLESRNATVRLIYLPSDEHGEKVGLDDFIAHLKKKGRDDAEIRAALLALANDELHEPTANAGENEQIVGIYQETKAGLARIQQTQHGELMHPLTNFTARIAVDVTYDDGAETSRSFEIQLRQGQRRALARVALDKFAAMRWPVEALGPEAVVYAFGAADHARVAIQLLSKSPARRIVYTHTGWRRINNEWVYLHCGGGIGKDGPVADVEVSLPPELAAFHLESSDHPKTALRASLELLDLGPDRVMIPVYGAIWRSIICGADFSVFLYGRTGVFKTELATLAQQHFGAGFDARHLGANFNSTANANEALAFATKDAVLVVDEMHPPSSGSERDRMHRDATRLLRSQGNTAGRARMRSDGSLRPPKPPRGLLLATGEELPRGHSASARMLIVEIRPGDIPRDNLSGCQRDARAGLYVQATAAFLQWLAQRFDDARAEFQALQGDARAAIQQAHARTADIRAQLIAAYSIFLRFLIETKAVDMGAAGQLKERIATALEEAAHEQEHLQAEAEPTAAFLSLLISAISAGQAHLADSSGNPPVGMESAAGWRKVRIGSGTNERLEFQPQGERVGWLDRDDLYLERDASYRAAQRMAGDGYGIEVKPFTLVRRLRERGLLGSVDKDRQVLTVRRTLEGRRCDVLHLRPEILGLPSPESRNSNHRNSAETSGDGRPGRV